MISEMMCVDLLFYCLPCLTQEPTDGLSMNSESNPTHISFNSLLIYAFVDILARLPVHTFTSLIFINVFKISL